MSVRTPPPPPPRHLELQRELVPLVRAATTLVHELTLLTRSAHERLQELEDRE